jgi:transposase
MAAGATNEPDKVLEDAAITLGSVASTTLGKSGRAMIEALIAGERDPEQLAQIARLRLRAKLPELVRALHGRFATHHALLLRLHLDHVDHLDAAIATIENLIAPFPKAHRRLTTIPGVAKRVAEVMLAEIGADMTQFPSAAGIVGPVVPGQQRVRRQAPLGPNPPGRHLDAGRARPAAWATACTRDTCLSAEFWRLARRIGKNKAAVAVAHSILVIAYHLLANGVDYCDLDGDYFAKRLAPIAAPASSSPNSRPSGHTVTVTPAA